MASKGRGPPPHLRRPLPGPGVVHPDPYASAIRPPPGGFPPYEMLPPHEVIEQKLSVQHMEIEKLVTENRRLAATHGTLRQDLATAKHELQLVHARIEDAKAEKEQQMRGILDKMSMMEAELESAEPIKLELQKARAEAESLVATREELITKVQQLTRDLHMAHSEAQQIPSLMSELDRLRQEYQHCRATYDYEKKLYHDHLESLQVMEKNYMAMSREVDNLRAQLTNPTAQLTSATNFDPRTGGPYAGAAGYNESVHAGNYATGQSTYGVPQGQSPLLGAGTVGAAHAKGNSPHVVAQSAAAGPGTAHDAPRGPSYNAPRGTGYDPQRGQVGAGYESQRVPAGPSSDAHRAPPVPNHDAQRGPSGPSYDAWRAPSGPGYDAQRPPNGPGYNVQRGPGAPPAYEAHIGYRPESQKGPGPPGHEAQRAPSYDAHKGYVYDGQRAAPTYNVQRGSGDEALTQGNFDAQKGTGATVGPQGQVSVNNVPYPSTAPSARAGTGYDSVQRGGNAVRR